MSPDVRTCPACGNPIFYSDVFGQWMHSNSNDDQRCSRGDRP